MAAPLPSPTLTEPVVLAGRTAPSRVVFGPHETNLCRRRAISERHAAYYRRRAVGGAGVIITETASVTADDWPYERAPLAADCGPGWTDVAAACRDGGPPPKGSADPGRPPARPALVLAGLGHAGSQGSSAYSQSVLWAPSRVPDAASREMPAEMEQTEIDAVVDGFSSAARLAAASSLDGVEVDAGAYSLLRQFHSGLTNLRGDDYGRNRLLLTTQILAAVRVAIGPGRVLALRLSCDELAPWAGVTPDQAAAQVAELASEIDMLTVVRGGPYSSSAYRPGAHSPPGFNIELTRRMREAAGGVTSVVLQGSMVDPGAAEGALVDMVADLVEMTRAQIAEPDLVQLVRDGAAPEARPCILCNQTCRVRDPRNPIVTCIGEPRSGHEIEDPSPEGFDIPGRLVLVVGGGPAGLECARVLATRGHRVRVAERSGQMGGMLRLAATGPGRERLAHLTDWLESECLRLGVDLATHTVITPADLRSAAEDGTEVILATGSRSAGRRFPVLASEHSGGPAVPDGQAGDGVSLAGPDPDAEREGTIPEALPVVIDAVAALRAGHEALPAGDAVVHDPVGGPIGVGIAEWLAAAGRTVHLVCPDQVAGTLLSLSGDLADANGRLHRAGVDRQLRAILRGVVPGRVVLEDVWTAERRSVACQVVIDCGHRLVDDDLYTARPGTPRAGDCVAPRTAAEAILEGRRRALELVGAFEPSSLTPAPGVAPVARPTPVGR